MEGNEFIINFFPTGSILNSHVVFIADPMFVNIRARVPT